MVIKSKEDYIKSVVGSSWAMETSEGVIKGWSPNSVLGMFFFVSGENLVTVTQLYNKKLLVTSLNLMNSKINVVSALSEMFGRRKYSMLEFFCWDKSVESWGIQLVRILGKISDLPVLSAVGGCSPNLQEIEENLSADYLVSAGAEPLEIKGYDQITFQPATYEMDTQIREEVSKNLEFGKSIIKIKRDSENPNYKIILEMLNVVFDDEKEKEDLDEFKRKLILGVLSKHRLGVGVEEFDYFIQNVTTVEEDFRNLCGFMKDRCGKNDILKESELALRIDALIESLTKELLREYKDVLGEDVVNLFIVKRVGEVSIEETLMKLINFEKVSRGGQDE